MSAHLEPRAYQAALVDLNMARSPDPDPYPFWHQAQITGGQNYAQWDDRQASEYLEQARVEQDVAERKRLYDNFQVRFANELPSLPLFFPVYNYAIDDKVQGVTVGPLYDASDRLANAARWFLEEVQAGEATPGANQQGMRAGFSTYTKSPHDHRYIAARSDPTKSYDYACQDIRTMVTPASCLFGGGRRWRSLSEKFQLTKSGFKSSQQRNHSSFNSGADASPQQLELFLDINYRQVA
jgi:hypothetical protein